MFFTRKWLTTVAGMAAATLMLAACGAGESSSDVSPAAGGGTASADAAAKILDPLKNEISWPKPADLSKAVDIKGKTVWWIPVGDSVPNIHAHGVGFTQAIEAAGAKFKMCDGKFNPSDIGNCMTSAARENAAAVVTDYVDYLMVPNAFESLRKAGIPVLVAGVGAPEGKSSDSSIAFYDTTPMAIQLNEAVAAAAVVEAGDKPQALAFRLTDSYTTRAATEAGAKKWQELCEGCLLETVEFTSANVDKLPSQVSATLVKNPGINVVLVPDDGFVAPVEQAVKTLGREIKIVSTGGALANMRNVAAGTQTGVLGNPPIYQGWEIAHALFQLLAGDEVTPKTEMTARYFNASNVGSLALNDQAFLSGEWYGDRSYEDAFLTAWKLK